MWQHFPEGKPMLPHGPKIQSIHAKLEEQRKMMIYSATQGIVFEF